MPPITSTKPAPVAATTTATPATTKPATPPPPAGTTRAPKNDDPKMVAAGHKAAAKAKQTERGAFALVYAFKYGGPPPPFHRGLRAP